MKTRTDRHMPAATFLTSGNPCRSGRKRWWRSSPISGQMTLPGESTDHAMGPSLWVESIKILLLGVVVYLSPRLFVRLGGRWCSELKTPNEFPFRAATDLRRRFWRAVESAAAMETRYKARGFPKRRESLRLPHFPQPRRRNHLQTINQGVGPFYSIGVGPFYVVKATQIPHSRFGSNFGGRSRLERHDFNPSRLFTSEKYPLPDRLGRAGVAKPSRSRTQCGTSAIIPRLPRA